MRWPSAPPIRAAQNGFRKETLPLRIPTPERRRHPAAPSWISTRTGRTVMLFSLMARSASAWLWPSSPVFFFSGCPGCPTLWLTTYPPTRSCVCSSGPRANDFDCLSACRWRPFRKSSGLSARKTGRSTSPASDPFVREAANKWIGDRIDLFEGAGKIESHSLAAARLSVEGDAAFGTYENALAHITGPPLDLGDETAAHSGHARRAVRIPDPIGSVEVLF